MYMIFPLTGSTDSFCTGAALGGATPTPANCADTGAPGLANASAPRLCCASTSGGGPVFSTGFIGRATGTLFWMASFTVNVRSTAWLAEDSIESSSNMAAGSGAILQAQNTVPCPPRKGTERSVSNRVRRLDTRHPFVTKGTDGMYYYSVRFGNAKYMAATARMIDSTRILPMVAMSMHDCAVGMRADTVRGLWYTANGGRANDCSDACDAAVDGDWWRCRADTISSSDDTVDALVEARLTRGHVSVHTVNCIMHQALTCGSLPLLLSLSRPPHSSQSSLGGPNTW